MEENDNNNKEELKSEPLGDTEIKVQDSSDVTKQADANVAKVDGTAADGDRGEEGDDTKKETVKAIENDSVANDGGESDGDRKGDDSKKEIMKVVNAVGPNDGDDGEGDNAKKLATGDEAEMKPAKLTRPIKRARTAYFIFRDENLAKIKEKLPGASLATIAKAIGQEWTNSDPAEKEKYQLKAAEERERVSAEIKALSDAGLLPEISNTSKRTRQDGITSNDLILPVARIRKIARLDPEVKGISKEGVALIAFATELFTKKLGMETMRIAQIQNRRTLMPEDVAEVCSTREQFIFLKEDIRDLYREQLQEKKNNKKAALEVKNASNSSKSITSFFDKK